MSTLARENASKIGLACAGELIGLLHDLGKYSLEFLYYLRSAVGRLIPTWTTTSMRRRFGVRSTTPRPVRRSLESPLKK